MITSSDLIQVVTLGSEREHTVVLQPGEHPLTEDTIVIVKTPCTVVCVQRYDYKYKAIQSDPGWQFVRYLWETVTPIAPKVPWWRRLFRRNRILEGGR